MSDEVTRLIDAAKNEAPDVSDTERRRIVRGVLEALDALIDEGDEDSTWPDPGNLGLLAAGVFPKAT